MIGKSVPRLESEQKVRGTLKYFDDVEMPGALHGRILRSSSPHARLISVDATEAANVPGVVAVLTRDDVIDNRSYGSHYGPVLMDQTIVALDKVRYVGDPIAAVAATSQDAADAALQLIAVEYEELPAMLDPEQALAPDACVLHDKVKQPDEPFADLKDVGPIEGTNVCTTFHLEKGDVEQAFGEADFVFEDTFTCPATQHAALEPHAAAASFDEHGKLTVWTTVQNPFVIRDQLAELFRLPRSRVRVISTYLGGGYGSKLYPKLEPIVSVLAFKAKRPVRIVLTREEVFQTITKHAAKMHLTTGVKKDGTITAQQTLIYLDTGAYAEIGPRVSRKSGYTACGPYATPNVKIDSYLTYTNNVPAGAFRGFGVTQSAWGHESQMDRIARTLNIDPLELRLKNLLDEGGEFATGERLYSIGIRECLEKAAEAIQWGVKPRADHPSKARGKGLACLIKATITPSFSAALVRLNEDGSAHVYVGTVDMGQGSDTVMAQIASEELGLPLSRMAIVHSDTDVVPYDLTTSSSRSTFHTGRAVQLACQDIKRQLLDMATVVFSCPPDEIRFADEHVHAANGSRSLSYRALLTAFLGTKGASVVGHAARKTSADTGDGHHNTSAFWFVGAGAAEVEVDRETGHVRLLRYATAVDVGKALNPLACRQQLSGAAIMGIGQALLEQMVYRDGLLINPNFFDYNLPRFLDVPTEIISILVEHPHRDGPYGAKGVGETGLIPVPPAIANAVEDAVGVRVKDLPITPEKVFALLRAQEGRHAPAPAPTTVG